MAAASGGDGELGSRYRNLTDDYTEYPLLQKQNTRKRNETNITQQLFGTKSKRTEYAEYYIIKNADAGKDLSKVSPFYIEKALTHTVGTGTITSRLRDGSLLIKCKNDLQAEKLLKLKKLGSEYNIEVKEHGTLNNTQGIIYCFDLKFLTEAEILDGLQNQHQKVTAVRKIKRKGANGELIDTALCILTFHLSYLPPSIKVGFHNIPVKMYIPNPMKCKKCFRFGHSTNYCKKEIQVCVQCSEVFHGEVCNLNAKCINCTGSHNNLSKECPRFKKEYEIQKIKTNEKISYFNAKKKFELVHPPTTSSITYSKQLQSNHNTTPTENINLDIPSQSLLIPSASNPISQNTYIKPTIEPTTKEYTQPPKPTLSNIQTNFEIPKNIQINKDLPNKDLPKPIDRSINIEKSKNLNIPIIDKYPNKLIFANPNNDEEMSDNETTLSANSTD